MELPPCYLFQGLSDSQLERLATITREVRITEGERLLSEGQEASEVYVLKEGAVELLMKVEEDFEIPVAILRAPGGCFGTSALTAPHLQSLSARCVEPGSVFAIQVRALRALLQEDRDLGCKITTNLATNLRDRLKETREELKVHFRSLFRSIHS